MKNQFIGRLFWLIKASMSKTSIYAFRPPGNLTAGIWPAQILSRIAQVVSPKCIAASLIVNRRGALQIIAVFLASLIPLHGSFTLKCPPFKWLEKWLLMAWISSKTILTATSKTISMSSNFLTNKQHLSKKNRGLSSIRFVAPVFSDTLCLQATENKEIPIIQKICRHLKHGSKKNSDGQLLVLVRHGFLADWQRCTSFSLHGTGRLGLGLAKFALPLATRSDLNIRRPYEALEGDGSMDLKSSAPSEKPYRRCFPCQCACIVTGFAPFYKDRPILALCGGR